MAVTAFDDPTVGFDDPLVSFDGDEDVDVDAPPILLSVSCTRSVALTCGLSRAAVTSAVNLSRGVDLTVET